MIDHRHAIELAATSVDFDLDDDDREQLDAHLRACESCRFEVSGLHRDASALASLPALQPPTWVRRVVGRPHGPRRAVLLLAAALVLATTVGVALAVGATLRDRSAPSTGPAPLRSATLVSGSERPSAEAPTSVLSSASPSPAPSSGPLPIAKPTSFPAGAGSAWMGPGPDGGVWVLADHSGGVGADAASVTVLGLLDRTGQPMPGWPIALTGWRCGEDAPPHGLAVAADGSIRLVCTEDSTSDGPQRHVAFAFDAAGRALPGWPVELPRSNLSLSAVVVGDELRILASEIASTDGSTSTAQAAAWWLIGVSASGEVRVGQRYEVADAAGSFDVRIASDGIAYRLAFSGVLDTVQTAITAFDLGGVRPGWPVTVDGIASEPAVGKDGLLVIVRPAKGQTTSAQTMSIAPSGGNAIVTSGNLPVDPLDDRTGAGSVLLAPIVASDGSAHVMGTNGAQAAVVRVDPGSGIDPRVLLEKPLQPQGTCNAQDTGCGAWRTPPALGPDGTLYVPESAVGEGGGLVSSAGGTLVAIAPDRSSPSGWPVFLPDTMAGFWALLARDDGTIDALAVTPADKGNTWTLVILGPDGKTRASTVVLLP